MITFHHEPLTPVLWDEIMPLLYAHWQEIAHYKDIPLHPDVALYEQAQANGVLRVFTVRDDGMLVGYANFFVRPNPHYATSVQAVQDVLFLHPTRRGLTGARFISWCDDQLRAEGVQAVYHHVKAEHNFGPMLERMGYELVDLIYSRRLDGSHSSDRQSHSGRHQHGQLDVSTANGSAQGTPSGGSSAAADRRRGSETAPDRAAATRPGDADGDGECASSGGCLTEYHRKPERHIADGRTGFDGRREAATEDTPRHVTVIRNGLPNPQQVFFSKEGRSIGRRGPDGVIVPDGAPPPKSIVAVLEGRPSAKTPLPMPRCTLKPGGPSYGY